jgi:hypothetical protein
MNSWQWKKRLLLLPFFFLMSAIHADHRYVLKRSFLLEGQVIDSQREGDLTLLNRPALPASLFKVVILAALLREGKLDRNELFPVEEHISRKPVDLREATFRSSNRVFLMLARRLDAEKLRQEAMRLQFFRTPPSSQFGRSDTIYRGEDEATDAASIHRFMERVALGAELKDPERLHDLLLWPESCFIVRGSHRETGSIHAKSGAWGGSAWMSGFCAGRRYKEVVTVYVPYQPPHWRQARRKAIHLFYEALAASVPDEVL